MKKRQVSSKACLIIEKENSSVGYGRIKVLGHISHPRESSVKERLGSRLSIEVLEQRKGKTCESQLDLREIARP